jgi:hypothetical protein
VRRVLISRGAQGNLRAICVFWRRDRARRFTFAPSREGARHLLLLGCRERARHLRFQAPGLLWPVMVGALKSRY